MKIGSVVSLNAASALFFDHPQTLGEKALSGVFLGVSATRQF